jgi:allantoin racemase
VAHKFTVVTTLARSIPALEHDLAKYDFERRGRIGAAEVPVPALEDEASNARARIDEQIVRALAEDRAEAIVLGCTGMAKLARDLAAEAASVRRRRAHAGLGDSNHRPVEQGGQRETAA